MSKLKVYLDNCCFNRPFDDQSSLIVQMETHAKLHVQELIIRGELLLCWSFVLDYENGANPFAETRNRVNEWKHFAFADCEMSGGITEKAVELMKLGLRQMDASHIACAIFLGAEFFLTTDKKVLNKPITEITVINPIDFLRRYLSDD